MLLHKPIACEGWNLLNLQCPTHKHTPAGFILTQTSVCRDWETANWNNNCIWWGSLFCSLRFSFRVSRLHIAYSVGKQSDIHTERSPALQTHTWDTEHINWKENSVEALQFCWQKKAIFKNRSVSRGDLSCRKYWRIHDLYIFTLLPWD